MSELLTSTKKKKTPKAKTPIPAVNGGYLLFPTEKTTYSNTWGVQRYTQEERRLKRRIRRVSTRPPYAAERGRTCEGTGHAEA